jgi:hypothetical protein
MKIDVVMLLIALAIAALIAFGFYSGNSGEPYVWLITLASGGLSFVTLSGIIAVGFNVPGGAGNVKIISVLFFIIFLVSNIIFSFVSFSLAPYIIINGISFLLYVLIGYGIIKALQ